MFDKFEVELKPGDLVIYTSGGQSEYDLFVGRIISISDEKAFIEDVTTGRTQRKGRRFRELISLEGFKKCNPEFFI